MHDNLKMYNMVETYLLVNYIMHVTTSCFNQLIRCLLANNIDTLLETSVVLW